MTNKDHLARVCSRVWLTAFMVCLVPTSAIACCRVTGRKIGADRNSGKWRRLPKRLIFQNLGPKTDRLWVVKASGGRFPSAPKCAWISSGAIRWGSRLAGRPSIVKFTCCATGEEADQKRKLVRRDRAGFSSDPHWQLIWILDNTCVPSSAL